MVFSGIITQLTKGEEMKYLIIFAVMSIAGTFGIVSNTAYNSGQSGDIPVEYIDFDTPIIIMPSV